MSDDPKGPEPTWEPSPYRLVPEFSRELGFGEDFEPDEMIAFLEKMSREIHPDEWICVDRIITYIETQEERRWQEEE